MNDNFDRNLKIISGIDEDIIDKNTQKRINYIKNPRKSPKKKITAIIAIAAAVAVLLSVMAVIIIPLLKPSGNVPIYTGMTVSGVNGESLSLGLKPLPANGQGFGMMLLDNSNTNGNNGNHGANNPNKKPVEDIINDSGTLAPTPSEQMYYAKQYDDIIITIHFDNPDEYKIMSFKLNGKAYADYMFEYGSDYENIMIKVNVGEALGIVDYTIDAIQYADRDVLKYVEMQGDPTLSIGVYNENVPVPAITNEKIGTNSVSFDIDLPGENSLAALSGKLYAIVADDTEIVKQQELTPGQTSVKFDGLKTGTAYRYAIVAEYDALDGNGYKSYILTEKEFTTEAIIMIENVTPTENSVSFVLKWNDIFTGTKALTSLELYQGENKIKDVDFSATEISDLISDTEYTLVAKYDNNGAPETAEFTLKTAARTVTYTVNHYIENLENEDYTLKETDNLTAPENTDLTPKTKLYSGFTSPAKQTVKVLPDGSLVVDYYYTRNTYTITFVTNGGTAIPKQTLKYEAALTLPDAVRGSDTFGGWFTNANLTTAFTLQKMGAANATLYAYWEGETKPGRFNYSSSSSVTITRFKGTETNVVIPKYVAGKPVTSIGEWAFDDCTSLISITIPDSVKSIGECAFYDCYGLMSINIPDSVTIIGSCAFCGCYGLTSITIPASVKSIGGGAFSVAGSLKDVYITDVEAWLNISFDKDYCSYPNNNNARLHILDENGDEVTDIVLPDSVKSIGDYAFQNCTELTSITIPDSVTSIGKSAFYDCTGLTSITIPDSVTSIGNAAFYRCTGLTSVTIGNGVTRIEHSAFYGCTGLKDVYITDVEAWLNIYFGDDYARPNYYGKLHILDANENEVTEIVIPDSVTSIGNYEFRNCTGLTSINIPDSVTTIGEGAFCDCTGLTSITIPDSVTSIGKSAFSGCTGLTSITIPDSVKSIGDSAFSGCSGLTSITIPDSVKSIGDSAFRGCTSLISITIPDSVKSIGDSAFRGCTSLISITIPDSVTSIGNSAFYYCTGLTSITIPDSVTSIGDWAFGNCSGLTSITIPDSVTSIGEGAFYGCSGLTSITIPDGVTSIGYRAFYDCTELTSITIPDSVTSIGDYAFYDCCNLKDVYITDIEAWLNISFGDVYARPNDYGNLHILDENGNEVTELIIPDRVKSIGERAFYNCTSLISITIPDSVTSIGNHAFSHCTELTSITIPDSVKSIGDYAFEDCTSLISITIPDSVTSIGDYAFYRCTSLISITIPDSVKSIGKSAFQNCTGLTSITIPDSVTSIGNAAFYCCTGLTSITIPDSVTSIGDSAFSDCTSLISITIPDSVTSIGIYSFSGCTSLISITIPDSVTSIGESAFYNCYGLTSITIGKGVKRINSSAFSYCYNLTDINFGGTKEEWNKITKSSSWNINTGNYTIHCTDGDITKE